MPNEKLDVGFKVSILLSVLAICWETIASCWGNMTVAGLDADAVPPINVVVRGTIMASASPPH